MSQKFFYNKIITRAQAIALSKHANDPASFRDFVSTKILSEGDDDPERKTIYVDYFINTYKFCCQHHFSAEKVSTLMSIAVYIFNESIEKKLRFSESFELFKSLLSLHEIQREPYFMGVFNATEKSAIIKYFQTTFYKHYTLYDVAMTKTINYRVTMLDKLEAALPRLSSLTDGIEITPQRIPQLAMFLPKVEDEEDPRLASTLEAHVKWRQEEADAHKTEGEGEEEKEEVFEYTKNEEDLKLEAALGQTLKVFYNKLDTQLKEKSEEMVNKIDAKSGKSGAAPAAAKKK